MHRKTYAPREATKSYDFEQSKYYTHNHALYVMWSPQLKHKVAFLQQSTESKWITYIDIHLTTVF
jgi:hypothetical protein